MSERCFENDFLGNSKQEFKPQTISIVSWYHILRANYHWTIFQAIRYALWLAR
jgi:hypothetical protein